MQTIESFRAKSVSLPIVSTLGILLATTTPAALAGPADEAEQIASLAGFHGGLVIHVGCGDGKLTSALRLADNSVVQGLEADVKRVETARAAIRAMGVYGPVSVMHWNKRKLPYVDNLATLVVCEDAGAVPAGEVMRVLRPYGAVAVKRDGKWTVTVKPQLQGTDQWEQHYHGADNNAVAQDAVVGPPRRYQWLGEPQWQRSHLATPISQIPRSSGHSVSPTARCSEVIKGMSIEGLARRSCWPMTSCSSPGPRSCSRSATRPKRTRGEWAASCGRPPHPPEKSWPSTRLTLRQHGMVSRPRKVCSFFRSPTGVWCAWSHSEALIEEFKVYKMKTIREK